ncbi:MAG: hypothetical protein L6435_02530 [Anaerolineae bacterium]|nr:hypothetical protein [Anaerolineae bacterium]
MPLRTMEHVKGMHDVRHQQSIRHSTARGTVFQQLERLAQEKERALTRARLWASKLKRGEERIAEIDRQREALLRTLEPVLRAELESL